jgi:hypothetical protein
MINYTTQMKKNHYIYYLFIYDVKIYFTFVSFGKVKVT